MSELKGPPSEIRFTVTVTRAGTGKVETYDIVGTPVTEETTPAVPDNETKEQ